jgi:hypothetical protein
MDGKYFYVYEEETFRDKNRYPKQRFKQIIGPYILVKKSSNDWYPLTKVRELPLMDCIIDICRFNLINHGFKEKQPFLLVKDYLTADLNKIEFTYNGKNVVLGLNDGYLCIESLRDLINFQLKSPADLFNFTSVVKRIGLFYFEKEEPKKEELKKEEGISVDQLINILEKVIGKEPTPENPMRLKNTLNNQINLKLMKELFKKYPGFEQVFKPKIHLESLSLKEFQQKIGY